ncbi:Snf7-domain-containing protein [Paramicrosporidium saccamoebae]|uniref:Vacuolar-sorting protein SNF7 n=1 Tax=Paramicrosporidium saccamoebae TaxID=1246581 RepID=A0A2H9TH57_9FUNG|nr:Snf7-domain-containing protein [Paramicrosporidium saccamoebae]
MRLFGRSKKKEVEGPQESIVQMRATLEMLEKKEKHLETKIAAEATMARQQAVSNKSSTLTIKVLMCSGLNGAETKENLLAIENANVNMETLKAMKAGSQTMKTMHGEMDVDKVDATMDDIREQMDLANEINAAISTPLGMDYGVDEDELNEELEQLEQTELDRAMLDVKTPQEVVRSPVSDTAVSLPGVPATAVDEDAELEELRKSMAI